MFGARLLPLLLAAALAWGQRPPARGPLRVLDANPRWFTDGSGLAVVLTGSHVWQNLQDNGLIIRGATSNPPPVFDYPDYLKRLEGYNHNFFRLWRWEVTKWTDKFGGGVKHNRPHPWLRTGPGRANDGELKFDISMFDEDYFLRLRERVKLAGDRGFYVSVMLFEGWELQFTDGWQHHPMHAANNINELEGDLNGDGQGTEINTLNASEMGRRVLEAQRAYVRKAIDAVNDLDNVLYEICNEATGESTAWQYAMVRYVKEYEAGKPKQHPVGMTFQYKGGTNATLFNSPADWISPNPGSAGESYRDNPCASCTAKIVLSDTDHLWGHTGGDNIWVWKSFLRGLHPIFMEEMLPSPTWQDGARRAMGQVQRMAAAVNLAGMKPENGLSQTRYCLADRGREYLVFQWDKGEFTVNLKEAPGEYSVRWLDVNQDRVIAGKPVQGGDDVLFTTPFPGPAVLWLKRGE